MNWDIYLKKITFFYLKSGGVSVTAKQHIFDQSIEFLKIGLVELGRVELEARLYMRTDDFFYIARFPRSRNISLNVLYVFF